ncbi:MAG: twin-arginine translocase subunit TatC [bacterium]
MSRRNRKNPNEMNFLDHLDELRVHIFRAFGGLLIATIIGYIYSQDLQRLLLYPFAGMEGPKLALLTPTEGFLVQLKISLIAGVFISLPWIFYQLWSFIAPGLFEKERKMVLPVVFSSSVLFLVGAGFAVFVIPMATRFFMSFTSEEVANFWSLGKFIDFELRMFLAFGIVFELPLLIYFLARFGVVTPKFLRTYRRHMYVAFLLAAAIITPPDVFTQIVLAVPLVVLYEASIFLAVIAQRKYNRVADQRLQESPSETIAAEPAGEEAGNDSTAGKRESPKGSPAGKEG